jgi:hypothetical protein
MMKGAKRGAAIFLTVSIVGFLVAIGLIESSVRDGSLEPDPQTKTKSSGVAESDLRSDHDAARALREEVLSSAGQSKVTKGGLSPQEQRTVLKMLESWNAKRLEQVEKRFTRMVKDDRTAVQIAKDDYLDALVFERVHSDEQIMTAFEGGDYYVVPSGEKVARSALAGLEVHTVGATSSGRPVAVKIFADRAVTGITEARRVLRDLRLVWLNAVVWEFNGKTSAQRKRLALRQVRDMKWAAKSLPADINIDNVTLIASLR